MKAGNWYLIKDRHGAAIYQNLRWIYRRGDNYGHYRDPWGVLHLTDRQISRNGWTIEVQNEWVDQDSHGVLSEL